MKKTDRFIIDQKFNMNQQHIAWLLKKKKKKINTNFRCINRIIISKLFKGNATQVTHTHTHTRSYKTRLIDVRDAIRYQ